MLESLVQKFLRSPGEALFVIPNQKLVVLQGGTTQEIGREPISGEIFRTILDAVVPGSVFEDLVDQRHKIPYDLPDTEPLEIRFGKISGASVLMIWRLNPPSARQAQPSTAKPKPENAKIEISPKDFNLSDVDDEPIFKNPLEEEIKPKIKPGGSTYAEEAEEEPETTGKPIDRFLERMIEVDASDLHLSSNQTPYMRIHGKMKRMDEFSRMGSVAIENYLRDIMSEANREEFAKRNDTDFAYEIVGLSRFRVNVFRDRFGVGAVIRGIPSEVLTVEDLDLPPAVVSLGDLSKGLVLVTGPTGSGKSTTLAAIIDYINKKRYEHIITIEDPIEFVHENQQCLVNQREVGPHTAGFKSALRAALREDPDIVLVGELRDLETIAIALETAETGHLVFGTLHTNTALSAVDRMVDQFPPDSQEQIRVMLADTLKGVVAQTLLRRIGGGRIAALEILIVNSAMSNLIREGKSYQIPSIMQTTKNLGNRMLNECLADLVVRKIVEPDEAYSKAMDKKDLLEMFRANEIEFFPS